MTVLDFLKKKNNGRPISMVTCYDSWSAALIAKTEIDCVLVGDSVAMTLYGHENTLNVDVATMAAHTAAVRRGLPDGFIIGDMPFLSFRMGLEDTMRNVGQLIRAGANAIKLEGADGNTDAIRHIVESGVPVMGHLGLTPQSVHRFGGFKVQARGEEGAARLEENALALQEAGCFAVVLEAVPSSVAAAVTKSLRIPVIGIGAGPDVDGQVLVLQDLLGLSTSFDAKFTKKWMDGAGMIIDALQAYHEEVGGRSFPTEKESYQ